MVLPRSGPAGGEQCFGDPGGGARMEEYLQQITRLMNLNGEAVEGMMVVNKDGIVEYYKPGNPFGKLPEEFGRNVVGNHLLSVYTELSEENSTVMNTLRTGQITVGEKQVLTHEDLQITMVTTTYPILNQQGEIQGAVDIAQILDVRSLKGVAPVSADHSVLDDIVTRNKEMARLKAAIRTIAKNDSATLIYGETGTGKELFAEALHALSGRRDKPFLSQNCAAIPENLLESMFFGTERGGFTGAESKKGLFELADGGTLFLDEINSMDTAMQAKLLKALEEQKVRRIGGREDIHFDVRIVCASNEDPETLVEQGRLRSDFYYRIGVVRLRLPPLRERPEDILPLTEHYIQFFNQAMHKQILGLSQMTKDLFLRWSWPGNVRELKNTIEGAFNLESSAYITLDSVRNLLEKLEHQEEAALAEPVPELPKPLEAEPLSFAQIREQLRRGQVDLKKLLAEYEAGIIREALQQTRRLNAAAEKLSMSPQKLQYRMEKLGLKENQKNLIK